MLKYSMEKKNPKPKPNSCYFKGAGFVSSYRYIIFPCSLSAFVIYVFSAEEQLIWKTGFPQGNEMVRLEHALISSKAFYSCTKNACHLHNFVCMID